LLLCSCNPNAEKANKPTETDQVESVDTSNAIEKVDSTYNQQKSKERELSDDKIKSLKVAYFTKELDLSAEEAEKFWPIYNKHNAIYEELGDTEWDAIKKGLREVNTFSEVEAEELLSRYKTYLNTRLQNRLRFINELEKVISPKKVMLLKHAEYNFNKKLLKQYRSGEATTK
jgi:hypothetical protein